MRLFNVLRNDGQIRRILRSNSFAVSDGARRRENGTFVDRGRKQTSFLWEPVRISGSGLWLTESMFNHSCAPNCEWTQIGDQMFIRCTRPIPAGVELSISYQYWQAAQESSRSFSSLDCPPRWFWMSVCCIVLHDAFKSQAAKDGG
jgi:hypothetical protein